MIARDQIVYISGQFRGEYRGELIDASLGASNQKTYGVEILPNAVVADARLANETNRPDANSNLIKFENVKDVNVYLQSDTGSDVLITKEHFTDIIISQYSISDSGKDGHQTHGVITGTFFGTIRPIGNNVKNITERITSIPVNQVAEPVSAGINTTLPILPKLPSWRWRSCLFQLLQLLGLLLLLLFLLSKCNSCRPTETLPLPMLDSISEEYTDTMLLQHSNAYITFNDWDRADNDRITVKLNEDIIAKNILIGKALQTFQINQLHKGNNRLEIIPTAFGKGNCTVNVEIGDSRNIFRFNCNIKKGETVVKNILVR